VRPATKASTGTVLIRDWGGQSHRVTVLDRGVCYRQKNYRSLSQVASIITGTPMVGTAVFWPEDSREGGIGWNPLGLRFNAAPSIPARVPKKVSSRISIPNMPNVRRARRSSKVRPEKAGDW
jgi:hypothetical protein